jgi:hypothetical protein
MSALPPKADVAEHSHHVDIDRRRAHCGLPRGIAADIQPVPKMLGLGQCLTEVFVAAVLPLPTVTVLFAFGCAYLPAPKARL